MVDLFIKGEAIQTAPLKATESLLHWDTMRYNALNRREHTIHRGIDMSTNTAKDRPANVLVELYAPDHGDAPPLFEEGFTLDVVDVTEDTYASELMEQGLLEYSLAELWEGEITPNLVGFWVFETVEYLFSGFKDGVRQHDITVGTVRKATEIEKNTYIVSKVPIKITEAKVGIGKLNLSMGDATSAVAATNLQIKELQQILDKHITGVVNSHAFSNVPIIYTRGSI